MSNNNFKLITCQSFCPDLPISPHRDFFFSDRQKIGKKLLTTKDWLASTLRRIDIFSSSKFWLEVKLTFLVTRPGSCQVFIADQLSGKAVDYRSYRHEFKSPLLSLLAEITWTNERQSNIQFWSSDKRIKKEPKPLPREWFKSRHHLSSRKK